MPPVSSTRSGTRRIASCKQYKVREEKNHLLQGVQGLGKGEPPPASSTRSGTRRITSCKQYKVSTGGGSMGAFAPKVSKPWGHCPHGFETYCYRTVYVQLTFRCQQYLVFLRCDQLAPRHGYGRSKEPGASPCTMSP